MEEPLVVIYEAPTMIMAQLVKDVLEQAGLPIMEKVYKGVFYRGLTKDFSLPACYSHLLALESQAETARRLVADFLAAYERGDLALGDDEVQHE